ncbi:ATP-dependent DNA helicase PIF1-like protein [Tanacetum coccineum]
MLFQSATFLCEVKIDKVRTKKGWNYPSCGGEKCKKGALDRKDGHFWCDSCNSSVEYPVMRHRVVLLYTVQFKITLNELLTMHSELPTCRYSLELEISDNTAEVVVVMFDETTTSLLGCSASCILDSEEQVYFLAPYSTTHTLELKSHTYFEHGNYESFTCWNIVIAEDEEGGEGGVSSGTVAANEASKVWICYVREWVEDSDVEESFVAESVSKEGDVACSSDTRKMRRSDKTTHTSPTA